MLPTRRHLALLPLIAALATAGTPAVAHAASGPVKFFDAFILRPAGLAQIVIGGVAMVTYPFVHWSGQGEDMIERLWTHPVDSVFQRPLGEI